MTAVGSVVLSLPEAFAECGWLVGSIILFVFAILMDVSLIFLVGCGRSAGRVAIFGSLTQQSYLDTDI
jgi:amino acid permease